MYTLRLLLITAPLLFATGPESMIRQAHAESSAPPSFVNDVQPVLTRYGCNAGGCHGKLAGQNGFRLSLRGYAPEDDHRWITEEELGRRINRIVPDQSLLLLKATGKLPHGGGRLFDTDSDAYSVLRSWIAQGTPGVEQDEPRVASIVAPPRSLTLAPGDRRQLEVRAQYTDGQERDVTWLAQFQANDPSYATVHPGGELVAERHGEVAVVVSYQGLVDTVLLTMPFPYDLPPELFGDREHVIDHYILDKLQTLRIPPAPVCDDTTFLRRVTLDLIGVPPTPDEVRQFLGDSSPDKRDRWVDHLLERPEFVDYWTMQLGDLLQNRRERDHDVRGVKGVRSLHAWLRRQVEENRPWDQLARDILTATGPSDIEPAVGYYIVTVGEKPAPESEVADSVAQAFLGTRIGCAKCHNHPLERYTQDDYFHFLAFFSQVVLDRQSPQNGPTVVRQGTRHLRNLERRLEQQRDELAQLEAENANPEAADLEGIKSKREGIERLEQEIEQEKSAPPTIQQPRTGERLAPQGLDRQAMEIPERSDPRIQLAEWITSPENQAFAGSMVNRLWKHFFSVGLIEPVDDLRDTNPPSHPALYDALVSDFIDSGYDLRHLMRRIVTSRTYQFDSETSPENAADSRFYSHYYPRRLPAEVLLDAIVQATGVPETFPGYAEGTRATQLPGPQIDSYFLTTFGRSERVTACACERSGEVTLPQLLHLQNSDNLLQKLRDPTGHLTRWLTELDSTDELLDQLMLATHGRFPDDPLRDELRSYFESEKADRLEVASDLFWALLNSKEFTFNY